jgi:hypothetical protein
LESEVGGGGLLEENIVAEMQAADALLEQAAEEDEQLLGEDVDQEERSDAVLRRPLRAPIPVEGDDLRNLIEDRLMRHPSLHLSDLHVIVHSAGLVTVGGGVLSDAEKLRVTEVLSALPGIHGLRNLLTIRSSQSSSA